MLSHDIIVTGVGGHGVLTMAAILAQAGACAGCEVRQSEVHGMAQRGGPVICHCRISPSPIHSALVPLGSADVILASEPMEAIRAWPWLREDGWIITSDTLVMNIPHYPPQEEIFRALGECPHLWVVPALDIARRVKAPRSANLVMIGALSAQWALENDPIRQTVTKRFENKGASVLASVLRALDAGVEWAQSRL